MRLCLTLLLATATTLAAQTSGGAPVGARTSWSTNTLGVLQLGPNVEFERALSPAGAFGMGARLPTLGVMSHVINDGIESGWTVYGIYHFYPKRNGLRGWFLGPHLEFGGTSNETYTSKLIGGGGEFGHRWIKPNGFSIVLGGLIGTFKSDDTWKDGSGSAGSEQYFVWMLNLSIGVAR